jgi:YHS domain-containing protein
MKMAATRLMVDTVEGLPDNQALEIAEPALPETVPDGKIDRGNVSTVKDPVCGMEVDPDKAKEAGLMLEDQGQTYYFCSEECALEFHRHGVQINPASGSDSMPDALPDHEAHQTGHQP